MARSAERAAVVLTPTQAVAEVTADRLGISPDKIMVTPLGVDLAWFTARPPSEALRRRIGLPKAYLLFVGGAGPRKALGWLLKAHEATPDLPPLVLAGPGHTQPRRATSGRSAICPMWTCGRWSPARPRWCCPSRDEGFGLPVLEAMACDVPVVCSDVPALREVSGGHASLVPFGDVEAMGAALTAALANPPTPAMLADRRTHAAEFTWRRTAELTVAAYRRAMA